MSALGQKRTCRSAIAMSALPPKADMDHHDRDVRFVQDIEPQLSVNSVGGASRQGRSKLRP